MSRRRRTRRDPHPTVTITRMSDPPRNGGETGRPEWMIETSDGRTWWTAYWDPRYSRGRVRAAYRGVVAQLRAAGDSVTFVDNKGHFARRR